MYLGYSQPLLISRHIIKSSLLSTLKGRVASNILFSMASYGIQSLKYMPRVCNIPQRCLVSQRVAKYTKLDGRYQEQHIASDYFLLQDLQVTSQNSSMAILFFDLLFLSSDRYQSTFKSQRGICVHQFPIPGYSTPPLPPIFKHRSNLSSIGP